MARLLLDIALEDSSKLVNNKLLNNMIYWSHLHDLHFLLVNRIRLFMHARILYKQ